MYPQIIYEDAVYVWLKESERYPPVMARTARTATPSMSFMAAENATVGADNNVKVFLWLKT